MVDDEQSDAKMAQGMVRVTDDDPHGQAALLLFESLIHKLIERLVIDLPDAVDIVATAAEMRVEMAVGLDDAPAALGGSLSLLTAIQASLARDLPD